MLNLFLYFIIVVYFSIRLNPSSDGTHPTIFKPKIKIFFNI